MSFLSKVVKNLRPGSEWIIRAEELEWLDQTQTKPTDEEIATEIARLQSDYDTKEYQRQRASEYPSIGDQLDALWKGGDVATEMLAKVQAVKAKYPKPE